MIVVTGMHRSGTSAVAMTLEALGLDFGEHSAFYGADQWNERGYFERNDVVDLNSRLLTGFPRTQGTVPSLLSQVRYLLLPSPKAVHRRARRLRGEMEALARSLDGMAVKDPRFCLTLGVWRDHVSAAVACLRHPTAVASSLHRRQRVPLAMGLRFWDHHAQALLDAPASTTFFLDFDALSGDDTASELSGLVRFLGLDITTDAAVAAFGEQFAPELRHFTGDPSEGLPQRTRVLWEALQQRRRAQQR